MKLFLEFTKWMIMSRCGGADMISRPWNPGCIPVAYCKQYGVSRIQSKLIKSMPAADLKHCILQRRVVAQKDVITNQWNSTVSYKICVCMHKIKIPVSDSTNSMCIIIMQAFWISACIRTILNDLCIGSLLDLFPILHSPYRLLS